MVTSHSLRFQIEHTAVEGLEKDGIETAVHQEIAGVSLA
jgi:hypothetical protein